MMVESLWIDWQTVVLPAGSALEGWRLLMASYLWQSTLIGAVGWIAIRCLRRRNAALRAEIALATMVLVLAAPWVTWGLRAANTTIAINVGRLSLPHSRPAPTSPPAAPIAVEGADLPALATSNPTAAESPALPRSVQRADSRSRVGLNGWHLIAAIWVAMTLWRAGRLVGSSWLVRGIVRRAESDIRPAIQVAFSDAAVGLGHRKSVRLTTSHEVHVPTLVGIVRPTLMIPALAPTGVDWRQVAYHELAHLRRGDHLALVAWQVAVVLLPWQPFLYLCRRQFLAAADEACDDWVVAAGTSPVDLADQLTVWLARSATSPSGLSMSHQPPLTRSRIMRLLSRSPASTVQRSLRTRTHFAVAASALVIGLPLATVRVGAEENHQLSSPLPVAKPAEDPQATRSFTPNQPARGYRVAVGDKLQIDLTLAPRKERVLQPGDVVLIDAANTFENEPIRGPYLVSFDRTLELGGSYGGVSVRDLNLEQTVEAVKQHLVPVLGKTDVRVYYDPASFGVMPAATRAPEQAGAATTVITVNNIWPVAPDGSLTIPKIGNLQVEGGALQVVAVLIQDIARGRLQCDAKVDVSVVELGRRFCFVGVKNKLSTMRRIELNGGESVLDVLTIETANLHAFLADDAKVSVVRRLRQPEEAVPTSLLSEIVLDETGKLNTVIEPGDRVLVELPERSGGGGGGGGQF